MRNSIRGLAQRCMATGVDVVNDGGRATQRRLAMVKLHAQEPEVGNTEQQEIQSQSMLKKPREMKWE